MAKKTRKKPAPKKTVAKKSAAKRAPAKRVVAKPAAAKRSAKQSAKKAQSGGGSLASVAPGLTVNDIEKSVAFYGGVLGFKMKHRWENDGTLTGGEMTHGNVAFYLGQDDWKQGRDRVKGQGTRMYITIDKTIDKYAAAIKARGGALTQEPADAWGMRTFALEDPDGYKITFMHTPKK
jgi:catechol 2,3-dioxygenase-like lactoylglutathione lyase family enzyme